MLGHVGDVGWDPLRCLSAAGTDEQGVDVPAEGAGEGERLQRDVRCLPVRVLQHDEIHDATPIWRRSSTTAGAAAAP